MPFAATLTLYVARVFSFDLAFEGRTPNGDAVRVAQEIHNYYDDKPINIPAAAYKDL